MTDRDFDPRAQTPGHCPTHEHPHVHEHSHEHEHPHVHEHEHEHAHHEHEHEHAHHEHAHTHDPANMRKIINRLSRSIGHLESIKRMLENDRDCSEVLIQIAAVRAEINSAGKALLKEHMSHCIVEAVEEKDQDALDRLNNAIDQFIK